jgi:hypothetical protein
VVALYNDNAYATSAYSDAKGIVCDLARPTIKLTNVESSGKIKISWNAIEGAAKYEVYRATEVDGVEGTYRLLKRTTDCEVVCTGLNPEKVYYFKLRAYTIVNGEKVYTDFSESVLSKTFYIPI